MKTIEPTKTVVHSFPIFGLLGVAFTVLKLCHVINWSWWLVTLPFWIGPALVLGILGGVAAIAGLALLVAFLLDSRKP